MAWTAKIFTYWCAHHRAKDDVCLVQVILSHRNCLVAELVVRLSAAMIVAAIQSRQLAGSTSGLAILTLTVRGRTTTGRTWTSPALT